MRSADPSARARRAPAIVAAVAAIVFGACAGAAPLRDAPAASKAPVTTATSAAETASRAAILSELDGVALDVAPAPAVVSDLNVRWRDPGVAVVTWQELPRRVAGRRLLRQSAPFDGSCISSAWRSDATVAVQEAAPQVIKGLPAGRCYRWTLTATDPVGVQTVIYSGPAFRPWTSGPSGWYPGERNHLWLPSLGIDEPIHHWSCTRSGILADVVYSWGCAGSNNEYLMGHAFGVFDRLYAAYPGRLQPGSLAWVADANGNLIRYRLHWAVTMTKKHAWTTGKWVFARTVTPVLTLQTCYGQANDQFLFVRYLPA
jgi:hypothetical protein